MNENLPVITIDGPSGSGKGTIARLVAAKTGFSLLDSGALYRLTALAAKNNATNFDDEDAVAGQAANLDVAFEATDGLTRILLAGKDVSTDIRQEETGMYASRVAAYPKVRAALLQRQRDFLQAPGLVADGRDMGTVIFPRATLKIFLTASAEERARRRLEQLKFAGQRINDGDYEKILTDIQERDRKDTNRAASPLIPAADAVILDSTSLSIREVFDEVIARFHERTGKEAQ